MYHKSSRSCFDQKQCFGATAHLAPQCSKNQCRKYATIAFLSTFLQLYLKITVLIFYFCKKNIFFCQWCSCCYSKPLGGASSPTNVYVKAKLKEEECADPFSGVLGCNSKDSLLDAQCTLCRMWRTLCRSLISARDSHSGCGFYIARAKHHNRKTGTRFSF